MGNERKLRLIQVAKEFKVSLNTIMDFLQKKGIMSDGSPNTLVDADTYAVLEKEFGKKREAVGVRDSVREDISLKRTALVVGRKLRLIQVAKEFNVGLSTIVDFLQNRGIESDGSPNTKVDAETYAVLEKEFGKRRARLGS